MKKLLGIIALAGIVGALPAFGDILTTPGIYELHNHPDGNQRPPSYGLRLDGLDGNAAHEFTFDFDDPSVGMFIQYDAVADSIHIWGTAFGGEDIGAGYAFGQIYTIDFLYTGVQNYPGDDDLYVDPTDTGNPGGGSGTITDGTTVWDLEDNGMGMWSFRLGDESNDNGHRFGGHPSYTDGTITGDLGDPVVVSGWGWLNHSGHSGHVDSSDWLFTVGDLVTPPPVTVVPEPASITLFGLGLAGMLIRRKRRS